MSYQTNFFIFYTLPAQFVLFLMGVAWGVRRFRGKRSSPRSKLAIALLTAVCALWITAVAGLTSAIGFFLPNDGAYHRVVPTC